jgi:murein DD-endopeptidase MepM/ murein hydrolase activator NlpD
MPSVQEAAGLAPERGARPGGVLKQPPDNPAARLVKVEEGDSLYRLARRYVVNVAALVETNRLSEPYIVKPGQTLSLPPPKIHVVEAGETLYTVSRRFNIETRSLAVMNGLKRPWKVWPGDELILPVLSRDQWLLDHAEAPVAVAATLRAPVVAAPAGQGAGLYTRSPDGPSMFVWPVSGQILRPFGPAADGQQNDGVDIAAQPGENLVAAADGTVVYAGDELTGYGNLVLVKHSGGWISAYAYAASRLVREGDAVSQGQPIAKAGAVEGGQAPQVHFELRNGRQPVDPAAHLPSPVTRP